MSGKNFRIGVRDVYIIIVPKSAPINREFNGLVCFKFFLISSALLGLKFVCFSFKYASTSITTTPISEMATWLADRDLQSWIARAI